VASLPCQAAAVTDAEPFALIVLLAAAVGLAAVLSSRLTQRLRIPTPALVLVGAAIAVQLFPALHAPPRLAVERVVTVALVCILFAGGMDIGWARFRSAAAPIVTVGVAGTILTAAAVLGWLGFGLSGYAAHGPDSQRLYGIVAVVVVFSVVVQGSLVPAAARLLRVPMSPVEPEPWALGVRRVGQLRGAGRAARPHPARHPPAGRRRRPRPG
jgi:NhaP-type Na+/H+ or K+/H+ antiporter